MCVGDRAAELKHLSCAGSERVGSFAQALLPATIDLF
jgi:hypothetical protein